MRWALEHFQVIVAVAGVIAYWLTQRQREKQGQPAESAGDGVPDNRPQPALQGAGEDWDRTRRIQKEIRRKIAQRRGEPVPSGEAAQPQAPARREEASPPVFQDPVQEMMREIQKRFAPPPEPVIDQEALARQRELDERLKALEVERAAVSQRVAQIAAMRASEPERTAQPVISEGWLTGLRDTDGLRRAIVLREIIGPPVGLR